MLVSINFKENLDKEKKYHKNDILVISCCCKKISYKPNTLQAKDVFLGSGIWRPDQRASVVEASSELQAALCLLCQSHS